MIAEELKELKSQFRATGDDLSKLVEKKFEHWRHYKSFQKLDEITKLIRHEMNSKAYAKIVLFAKHADLMKYLQISLGEFKPKTMYARSNPNTVEENVKSFNGRGKCRILICNIQAANVLDVVFEGTPFCMFLETELNAELNISAMRKINVEKVYGRSFVLSGDTTDLRIENLIRKDIYNQTHAKEETNESHVFPIG